ncbi:hypothetical protein [Polycladidibacter hongkongensis]|uniref:hypothetical protein n=1 Tax=Polycladidibacter hongkongensis TaxID=1647556 RepID=UPI00082D4C86|nr:hypothetical protein [Pseudovibrio hongkongensis]
MNAISLAALLLLLPGSVAAQDFYLVARDRNGGFFEGHQLQSHAKIGFRYVQFCGKSYYVRPRSVVWAKDLDIKGYHTAVERNSADGWIEVCAFPNRQVTLRQVGIKTTLQEAIEGPKQSQTMARRFDQIRETFNKRNEETGLLSLFRKEKPLRGLLPPAESAE